MAAAAAVLRRNPTIASLVARFSTTPTSSSSSSPLKLKTLIRTQIRTQSDPDTIADLFDKGTPDPTFHGDRDLYSCTVVKLRRARRPDLIERILENQLSNPSTPKSESFLTRILSLYSSARMPDHALRTFNLIPAARRTDRSLSALLAAFLDNRQPDRLRETFDTALSTHGVAPRLISHNVLLKSLANSDITAAHQLLDEMPTKGITPDIISYNTVLNGYLKKGDDTGFTDILKKINRKGLSSNVFTYNCRMTALCRKGRVAEAEELLDAMEAMGVAPNWCSFNILIDGFCKAGDVDSAMKIFRRMSALKGKQVGEGVKPNYETFNPLLRALVEKGEFVSALEICNKCLARKWAPPNYVVKDLIDGLVKGARVNEAKKIAEKMKVLIKGDAVDAWKKLEGELQF